MAGTLELQRIQGSFSFENTLIKVELNSTRQDLHFYLYIHLTFHFCVPFALEMKIQTSFIAKFQISFQQVIPLLAVFVEYE
jgi:hypothetical protein